MTMKTMMMTASLVMLTASLVRMTMIAGMKMMMMTIITSMDPLLVATQLLADSLSRLR